MRKAAFGTLAHRPQGGVEQIELGPLERESPKRALTSAY